MRPISLRRFDSLAGYIRYPWSFLTAEEVGWFEAGDEKLLGLISRDTTDNDYVATVLARDALNRFRGFDVHINEPTPASAEAWLTTRLAELLPEPAEFFHQGDEVGAPMDFFTPVDDPTRHSPAFEQLRTAAQWTPALGLVRELMHHFVDVDGNFVQQFQTAAFDARLWELYLYATFLELGYGFDRAEEAPDFHCVGPLGAFFVEATTVNAVVGQAVPANEQQYYDDYVPTRFGSSLFSKVQKKYWERQHVAGHPLVLAIQDFHSPGAMTWSSTGLVQYLYGLRQEERRGADGNVTIVTERIDNHNRVGRAPIPSNFFAQPDSEHISAVIANPGGTLSKFNRMGFLAGFGNRDLRMIRSGVAYQGDLVPAQFTALVHQDGYSETWSEGLSVYHNPNARIPLPEMAFPGAAHNTTRDGRIVTGMPRFFPLGSQTIMLLPIDDQAEVDAR